MTRSSGYDLHQVYPVTNSSCPVIFLMPSHEILAQGEANVLKGKSRRLLEFLKGLCHRCEIISTLGNWL